MGISNLSNADNLKAKHKYLDAIDFYEKELCINPESLRALNNLAIALESIGRKSEALDNYEKAIILRPDIPELNSNYASLMFDLGKTSKAILYHQKAVRLKPTESDFWSSYSLTLRNLNSDYSIPGLVDDLLDLFHRSDIDLQFLFYVSLNVIYRRILKKDQIKNIFNKSTLPNEKISKIQELLWALICRTVLSSLNLEITLKSVRDDFINLIYPNEHLEIICCIAIQNYISGGIYTINSIEDKVSLNKRVYDRIELSELAVYQLYSSNTMPFQKFLTILKENSNLLHPKFSHLVTIIYNDQNCNLDKVENLNSFKAETGSKYAQGRYERRPYPTWITIQKVKPINFYQYLSTIFPGYNIEPINNKPIRILIAGCGTGKQVLERALLFKNVIFTAIDISSTSLQYARSQAKRYKVNNIKFIQMDIERIRDLGEVFDVIECVGVVHHLEKPLIALSNLRTCLSENGFMKLGLYSRKAREDVEIVKNIIREAKLDKQLPPLEYRNFIIEHARNKIPKSILNAKDFYSVSGYENLLFNNVEHVYSIKEVFGLLNELSLDFIGFESNFNFSKKNKDSSIIEDWIYTEENNPLLFSGMYQPWSKVK